MQRKQIKIFEGRLDAISLSSLAKRHFGPNTNVAQDAGSSLVTPEKVNMQSMSGFMAEIKKLGNAARWDPSKKAFVIT